MTVLKTVFLATLLLGTPAWILAQDRDSNTSQQGPAVAPDVQGIEGNGMSGKASSMKNPSSGEEGIPYTRDAFSTSMTGAPATLGPGDHLEISVFDTPEMTQKVRVDSDGRITLALIGEINVSGMAPDKLAGVIARKLVDGNFMKNPQVSVFVLEYAGQMAYVTGEVSRPGAYALLRSHRLLDLLSVAGGLTARAGNTVTIVRGNAPAQQIQVDLGDKDEDRRNPEIRPGDSIIVALGGIVYVLGDVDRPGGFLLDRRSTLSVLQAVALAQGTKPSASLAKALLIRTAGENRQEIPLNLKAILRSENPDPILRSGDIVYVPSSVLHGMTRRSVEIIEESAGLAAVYSTRP